MKHTSCYRLLLVGLASLVPLLGGAEIPVGYYDTAVGKSGESLQSSLCTIISDAGVISYNGLWSAYRTTDVRDDGKVWDMYSAVTNYTFGSDQCGSYSGEGSCYNREHSVPKSWFDEASPMNSDIWHVYPTDGQINGYRRNHPFGEVGSGASSSKNSFSKWGSCVTPGYTGTVFEPNDEYKGDFARTYFYFATRYKNTISGWGGIFTTSYPHIVKWQLDMLLRWHEQDPVSEKELDRNEAVYNSSQGNRNPFIDYPQLVDLVFGDQRTIPFNPNGANTPYLETPAADTSVDLGTISVNIDIEGTAQLTIKGSNITSNLSLSIGGTHADYFDVNRLTLTPAEVNSGVTVTLLYYTTEVGTHTATLTISGGGLASPRTIALSGQAIDDFVALPAKEITSTSFVAAWTHKGVATDYELNVWYDDYSSSTAEKEILNTIFTEKPDSWTYSGYTNKESEGLRLASGSSDGTATTPALDLSGDNILLTVEAAPYRTDDAILYILVDDTEVSQVALDGTVTKTIPITGGTTASKITFKANAKKRLYLHNVRVTSGGGFTTVTQPGYPRKVGNVTQYTVTDLKPQVQYYYTVTPYENTTAHTISNTIQVKTGEASINEIENDHILIYTSGNTLYIINTPANSVASWYTIDGRLCGTRVLHAEESKWQLPEGLYLIRVIAPSMQVTERVYSICR